MATLERIRQRSGLLIIIIGLAMLAFILTDLLGSGNSMFRADARVVGKIEGRTVEITEFTNRMDEYQQMLMANNPQQAQNISRTQLAQGVWDQMLREEILGQQYEKLGMTVTSKELYNRLINNPNIRSAQAFLDQNTGQFNEALFQQYIANIRDNSSSNEEAAEAYSQWLTFEENVREQAQSTKYTQAIQKGLYYPSTLARMDYLDENSNVTAKFIAMEYSTIDDGSIELTDADFSKYYQDNKEKFKTKNTRSLEFVNFNIQPSQEDLNEITEELEGYLEPRVVKGDTLESFRTAENDSAFALSRSELNTVPRYYREDNLPYGLDSAFFVQEEGYIKGPYRDGDYFHLTKIADIKNLPDSVKARHVLVSYAGANNGQSQAQRSYQEAKSLADSLLTSLRADSTRFAEIARSTSDDPGSGSRGGDLGWFNDEAMVKPFSDFAFQNDKGDIGLAESQFGFHIIQILDQGGSSRAVKLYTISREITPSDETYDNIYNQASAFATEVEGIEDFASKAEEQGYSPRPITKLEDFDENIPGIGANREIVKWTHDEETEVGDIQLFNNNNNSFVVVILTEKNKEGYADLETIKERIRPEVIKQKKAEMLKEKIKAASGSDINAIAQSLNLEVKNQVTNLGSAAISGYGREPKVIGVMAALEPGKVSRPIEGERGVYLVQVESRTPASDLPDYASRQEEKQNRIRPRVAGQAFVSLKEQADITDRRANFY